MVFYKRHATLRLWFLVLLATVALPVLGCDVILGGHTAEQVFSSRQVAALMQATPQEIFPDPQVAALAQAAGCGDTAELERLVKSGANLNGRGHQGATPLIWALFLRNKPGLQKLLQLGANPNLKLDGSDDSVLTLAARGDDPELVEILLKGGADPNIRDSVDSPLQHAVAHLERDLELRKQLVELLLKYGADINQADVVNETAATTACALGEFNLVIFLLEKGYKHDLIDLARCTEIRVVPDDSEAYQWKLRVLDMLKERGVQFPLPEQIPLPPL